MHMGTLSHLANSVTQFSQQAPHLKASMVKVEHVMDMSTC